MRHLLTALILAPLAALHAADTPSLQPPQHLAAPKPEHAVTNRAFTGIPSMAVAPKGRLWATWYAGVTPAEDAKDDYLTAFRALAEVGDYFVVNVSSPNTPGLRDLQAPEALRGILRPLVAEARARGGKPILLKLAPDLADEDVDALATLAREEGLAGLVLANTTISREAVAGEPNAGEAGGLSGPPLKARMLALVARVHRSHGAALPIVAAGGLETVDDVRAALTAGATLVQLYTAFVYGGPGLPGRLHRALAATARAS